ncbi:MAG: glycogen-binding domain-containing protein [Bryobacterales bacterium]|nr:glycogen-binding domain-containing protein [Bryobacterales bacterium]
MNTLKEVSMKKAKMNTVDPSTEIKTYAPEASDVFLAGTFNDWNPASIRMEREPDGSWIAKLKLAPGQHEYKFFVDGCWCCDPGGSESAEVPAGYVQNAFGTLNRIIHVSD